MNNNSSYPKQAKSRSFSETASFIRKTLCGAGIEPQEAWREAEIILDYCTGYSLAQRHMAANEELSERDFASLLNILEHRKNRIPLQYCLGHAPFMGMKLKVEPGVFIPRTDTECLVEYAVAQLRKKPNAVIADIGTGSGALAIAIAKTLPSLKVFAIDVSVHALRVAQENAKNIGVFDRITFLHGDWIDVLPYKLHAIVSNPPYIKYEDRSALEPEVELHEPHEALYGRGVDSLDVYRDFAKFSSSHILPDGWILAEFGDGQAEMVADIFQQESWLSLSLINDVNGLKRAVHARCPAR